MFRIEGLKILSCNKFQLQLKQQEHWMSDMFPDCIREVYSTSKPSDPIRKAVVDVVLLNKKVLAQKSLFQELIQEGEDFAMDIVLAMAMADRWG